MFQFTYTSHWDIIYTEGRPTGCHPNNGRCSNSRRSNKRKTKHRFSAQLCRWFWCQANYFSSRYQGYTFRYFASNIRREKSRTNVAQFRHRYTKAFNGHGNVVARCFYGVHHKSRFFDTYRLTLRASKDELRCSCFSAYAGVQLAPSWHLLAKKARNFTVRTLINTQLFRVLF